MAQIEKILAQIKNNPKNVNFTDLMKVCNHYFGEPSPHFSQALSEKVAEGQRGGGAEGKEIEYLTSAPLLPCSPAQAQALRDVVRNPG